MISEAKSAFQLKGSLFTLTIMQLHHCNLSELKTQLAETIKKSPKLFQDAPIVLDFNNVDLPEEQIELENLIKVLREFNLYTVGIRTQSELLKTKAKLINLAILASKNDTAPATKKAAAPLNANKLITQPVRSGQQIYAANGDLIILASVSAGAEVLADGNIHIYGALRGRALAGIKGETDKRIFCKSLEAELISIAGHYLVNENLEQYKHLAWTQISLEDEQLKIEAI